MWTERYTVYYSTEKLYAVRRLEPGQPEEKAEYRKFHDKVEAERFYNTLVAERPGDRVEIYFSQSKWVRYCANHDEFGEPLTDPIGESALCFSNAHDQCYGPVASVCTCPCHAGITANPPATSANGTSKH